MCIRDRMMNMDRFKIIVSAALYLGDIAFIYGIYILCAHKIPYAKKISIDEANIKDFCLREGLISVSYTHLDVYKRQGVKSVRISK